MKIYCSVFALLLGLVVGTLPSQAAGTIEIHIHKFMFEPAVIHVPIGTEVVWINDDQEPHKVSSVGPQTVPLPVLDTGEKCAVRFPSKGKYDYFCTMHPHMRGTIVVE